MHLRAGATGQRLPISKEERRHLYRLLRIEVWIPSRGEIKINLPFEPDE